MSEFDLFWVWYESNQSPVIHLIPLISSYKEEDVIKLEELYSGINDNRDVMVTGEKGTKSIQLTKTAVNEDLGQSTIPYFDTQPLTSSITVDGLKPSLNDHSFQEKLQLVPHS